MYKIILPLALIFLGLISCNSKSEDSEITNHNEEDTHQSDNELLVIDKVLQDGGHFIGLEEFDVSSPISIDSMLENVRVEGIFVGQIKGDLSQVCQKAGCWVTFNNSNGDETYVFFKDHYTIPIETPSGTSVVINGQAKIDTLSVDFQKHLLDDASDAGEDISDEDYNAITEDKIDVSFEASGIIILPVQ